MRGDHLGRQRPRGSRRGVLRSCPLSQQSNDELDDALELFHFAFRRIVEEPDRILAAKGLGRVHHRILYFIRRNEGLSVGDLLDILSITKQSLHRPMQELLDAGLVHSARAEENRRTKMLALTPSGQKLEARLSGLQREAFQKAFRKAPKGEHAFHTVMFELGGRRTGMRGPTMKRPPPIGQRQSG